MNTVFAALYLICAVILPPCEYEDSNGCYWDAGTAGNGQGTSFIALSDGRLLYADGTFEE